MSHDDSRQGAWIIDTGDNLAAQPETARRSARTKLRAAPETDLPGDDPLLADPPGLGSSGSESPGPGPDLSESGSAGRDLPDRNFPGGNSSDRNSSHRNFSGRDLSGRTSQGLRSGWDWLAAWAVSHQRALAAATVYLVGSLVVTRHLWAHPGNLLNAANPGDQIKFEWMLGEAARSLLHPHNPLFSSTLSTGGGTNLIANTSILFFGYVFAPVTLLFGAGLSYLLIIAGNIVATAVVWRWFFRRHVTDSEPAAFVGGLFLGFSPAMMTHSLGHPNLTAQWLIPIMLHLVLGLYRSERRVRDGIVLGVLVFVQFFIAEEPLLLLAISLVLFLLGCALFSPKLVGIHWRGLLTGGVSAMVTAGALLAYPVYFQFDGPMASMGVPFSVPFFSQDLAGYLQFPNQSLGGNPGATTGYWPGLTEQAALFGGPLVVLFLLGSIGFAYRTAVRASLVSVFVLVALSLGPTVHNGGKLSSIPSLWMHLQNLPLFQDSLPVRMALAITPFVGYILVIVIEQATQAPKLWRLPFYAIIAAALVPLVPRPIAAVTSPPTPAFITQDDYHSCISGGRSLLTVPADNWNPLMWTASLTDEVPLAQAPFVYPAGPTDKTAVFGSAGRETGSLLGQVENSGTVVPATSSLRASVSSDLQYWNTGCVVLIHTATNYTALREELVALLGQPTTVYSDLDVWSVRE
jgi:hypothetical protein